MSKWWWVTFLLLSCAMNAQAQNCPAGIPSGGNPHCIPPDRPESPYYNGSGAYVQQPAQPIPQPIVMQQKWADRWGTIAYDELNPIIGTTTGLKSKSMAEKHALSECRSKGGKKCKIAISYHNGCAALLAVKGGGLTTGAGPTLDVALDAGHQQCKIDGKQCSVFYSNCSMAEDYWVRQ